MFKNKNVNSIIKLMLQYKFYIAVIMICTFIEPTLNSVMSFWLQKLFNCASVGTSRIYILKLLTSGFMIWIFKRNIIFINSTVTSKYISNARKGIKKNIFNNIFGLDTSNITETGASGEYISVFLNDVNLLETRYISQILSLISAIISLIILGSSFLLLNKKIAVIILVLSVLIIGVPNFFSKKLNELSAKYSNSISEFTQFLKEYILAYPMIKNYSIDSVVLSKFDKQNNKTEDSKFDTDYSIHVANGVGMLCSWFLQIVAVGIGLIMVSKGDILVGTVIAAQSFTNNLGNPMQTIVTSINNIKSIKAIVNKIDILSTDTNAIKCIEDNYSNEIFEYKSCDIQYRDVCLKFNENNILDHFSYHFEKDKKYLIIGPNGSGKSSIFKVLKKWYRLDQGSILINNKNISELKSDSIGKYVSYLNENVSLFSGSINDNITLYSDYDSKKVLDAVHYSKLDISLNKEIKDEGRNISSGEQRKIEIARCLLRSVPCIVFDEVISTLDIESAYEIEKMILDYKDKTIIMISHNFSGKLLKEYDQILIMNEGKLIDHGTYDELIQRSEYFKKICNIKFIN